MARNSAAIGECARASKGIICDDISEFESHMPSHAVRSPWASGPATNTGPLHTLDRKKPRVVAGLEGNGIFHIFGLQLTLCLRQL
jgi:hypothetical protein